MDGSPVKTALGICADLDRNPAVLPETSFSCYHGLGHGVMMHENWDLRSALGICDGLKSSAGRSGCWQGVFMENVNEAQAGRWWRGHFSLADPLAPCDTLDSKYQYECYINQFGWLMVFFRDDVGRAAQACLRAGDKAAAAACVSSIGLAATNPSWQRSLLPGSDPVKTIENAWAICRKFPPDHVEECVIPGVDNILATNNTNVLDTATAAAFCSAGGPPFGKSCFVEIGREVRYLNHDLRRTREICEALASDGRADCLAGAGQ
jgi:hypothetical protein